MSGRRIAPWLAAVIAIGLPAAAGAQHPHVVTFPGPARDPAYSPSVIRLPPGDSGEWLGPFSIYPLRSANAAEVYSADGGFSYSHVFATAGIYRYYADGFGSSSGAGQVSGMSGEVRVTTNQPPVASFTQSATSVQSGQEVLFDASESHDAEGPVRFEWDLDQDGYDDGTAPTVKRTYTAAPGTITTYVVRLRVTDGNADAVGPESAFAFSGVGVSGAFTGPTQTTPPILAPPPTGTAAPRPKVLQTRLRLVRRHVTARVGAPGPGRLSARLARLGETLARGSRAAHAGKNTIRLTLTAKGRRRLRGRTRSSGVLYIVFHAGDGTTSTAARPVTIVR